MAARALLAAVTALVAARAAAGGGGGAACGLAELACAAGGCVRGDAWCDGAPQCTDGSDEPAGCTPCNRTYHGRAGLGYALVLRAPRLPLLCHLTFAAGGGVHGDLVQLAFDEFHVGRYEPAAREPCPDGYMQLAELGRPFTGGSWCGAADGAALYYSETGTITVSLRLYRARLGEPFAFNLRYKFLSQREAVVRFGSLEAPLERGAVSPGTYCTRTYEECHRKTCRLQSPNYPGMYPRNVTCYWSLRQKDIPTCKHAMISVRQQYAHKMQIKRSIAMASLNKTARAVRAWRECTGERDRLIVYDGASTDDPVLVEYCGGDWLPRITSRGPEMLVAFHSSPFSAPPRPAPPAAPLRGFELDVDVIFADSDSLDYAREARRCEFHIKASSSEEESNGTAPARGRRGVIRAPAHTLPPNTTCTWTFHGRPGDLVWIYFSSFTHYSLVEPRRSESGERDEEAASSPAPALRAPPSPHAPPAARAPPAPAAAAAPCGVQLRIWDGGGAPERLYCDSPPALCARAALANATRAPRPCAPPDGYVSEGALLSLAATTLTGTATHPLKFALHYEFVDARLEGSPLTGRQAEPTDCARLVTRPGELWSPRNALWFGRGGARRMRCVYRLQAEGASVRLTLAAAAFGRSPRCSSRPDPTTGRPACHLEPTTPITELTADAPASAALEAKLEPSNDNEPIVPHLWIYESPWPGYRVPLACLCDNSSAPVTMTADGGALELELVVPALSALEDQRHVFYRGVWSAETAPAACAALRRLPQPGGRLDLVYPYDGNRESECGETPFLLEARGNRSVFLRVWGEEVPTGDVAAEQGGGCETTNRVLVYGAAPGGGWRLVVSVCPRGGGREDEHAVVVGGAAGGARALLVVWAARSPGSAALAWMEVWRATSGCTRGCGAVGCMDVALWCDGRIDCPGGGDEAAGCGAGARLRAALRSAAGAGSAGGAAALLALALAATWRWARRGRGKRPALGGPLSQQLLCEAAAGSPGS